MNIFFNNNNNNNANLFLPYTEIGASCHWSVLKGSLKHMHLMSTAPWSSLALKQSTIKKKKKISQNYDNFIFIFYVDCLFLYFKNIFKKFYFILFYFKLIYF
jgi:hypothetical protein